MDITVLRHLDTTKVLARLKQLAIDTNGPIPTEEDQKMMAGIKFEVVEGTFYNELDRSDITPHLIGTDDGTFHTNVFTVVEPTGTRMFLQVDNLAPLLAKIQEGVDLEQKAAVVVAMSEIINLT